MQEELKFHPVSKPIKHVAWYKGPGWISNTRVEKKSWLENEVVLGQLLQEPPNEGTSAEELEKESQGAGEWRAGDCRTGRPLSGQRACRKQALCLPLAQSPHHS